MYQDILVDAPIRQATKISNSLLQVGNYTQVPSPCSYYDWKNLFLTIYPIPSPKLTYDRPGQLPDNHYIIQQLDIVEWLTGIECPLYSFGAMVLKRPFRGPINKAAINEQVPASRCKVPQPEKSEYPIFSNQPSGDQVQCETMGYVTPEMQKSYVITVK